MLLANTRLVTHRWAVHHLTSSFLLEETHHHTPSLHVATESTSRVTQHALDSQDRHKAAAQQRPGALQSRHPACNSTPVAPARTPSGAPSHGEAVDGTAEAPDQQVARRTTSRTDTSHYNRLQHDSGSDATTIPPMLTCAAHPTFFASDPGATTATLHQSAKRGRW